MKIISFASAVSQRSPGQHETLIRQLKILLSLEGEREAEQEAQVQRYLGELRDGFSSAGSAELTAALSDSRKAQELGRARDFVIFLSQDVPFVRREAAFPLAVDRGGPFESGPVPSPASIVRISSGRLTKMPGIQ